MFSPASPALPAVPPGPNPSGAVTRGWSLPPAVVLPGALLVAVLISTQFLFQPFVWRNWPVDEVLLGWLDVLRDRAITALAIGMALVAAGRVPWRSPKVGIMLLCLAIASGAALGELAPIDSVQHVATVHPVRQRLAVVAESDTAQELARDAVRGFHFLANAVAIGLDFDCDENS